MRSTVFHLVSPVINGTIILPTLQGIGERPVYPPASVSSGLAWPWAGARPTAGSTAGRDGRDGRGRRCGVLQVVKTAQSRGRTERTLFKAFRDYRGPIKFARCGFPWEKTTSRPVASRISCSAALAENNDVRLSSRKVACSSVVPTTSTGNPGSVYTDCETAYAVISALRRRALCGAQESAERRNPLLSHYRLLHPSHRAGKR
jgi:hypothetical protein